MHSLANTLQVNKTGEDSRRFCLIGFQEFRTWKDELQNESIHESKTNGK